MEEVITMLDRISYVMGLEDGIEEGTGTVVIENGITCTDDGDANITITEDEEKWQTKILNL